MNPVEHLKRHVKMRVENWKQQAAASVLGPVLYETTQQFQGLPHVAWFRLSNDEATTWLHRALAVLKVAAEQERRTAQAAKDQAALDKLVAECYPVGMVQECYPGTMTPLPSNVTPIRTRRTGEDFEELHRIAEELDASD